MSDAATSSAAAPHQILRLLDMEAAPAQAEFNSKAVSPPLKQEEVEEEEEEEEEEASAKQ